ncbi:hypothetical protein D9M72_430980 [compost metagenome]
MPSGRQPYQARTSVTAAGSISNMPLRLAISSGRMKWARPKTARIRACRPSRMRVKSIGDASREGQGKA